MSATKLSILGVVLFAATQLAMAQDFPSRPIRLVVTFAPGTSNDILARLLAPKLAELLRQSVIVENRPGGSSIPGTNYVAKSAADGHTLLVGNTSHLAIMGNLFRNLPFDPQQDFAPVSILVVLSHVLVVHTSVSARSVAELIALARANPGTLNYASAGNGTTFHLFAELFQAHTGTKLIHVPYKGLAPAIADVLSGRVQLMFVNIPDVLAHIKSGRLRPIVWTGARRSPLLPEVPTLAEAGLADAQAVVFFALVAPRGTPKNVIARLNAETVKVLKQPEMHRLLVEEQNLDPVGNSPEEAEAFIRSESAKWAKVIKDAGIKVDD